MTTPLENKYFDLLPRVQHAAHCGRDDDKRQTAALAVWQWFRENIDATPDVEALALLARKLIRSKRKDVYGVLDRAFDSHLLENVAQPEQLEQPLCLWSIEMMPLRLSIFARAIVAADGRISDAADALGCNRKTVTRNLQSCEKWLRDHNQVI